MRRWTWVAILVAFVALSGCGDDKAERRAEETRRIMGEIFAGIRIALPASADPEQFGAAENRDEIAAALDTMARNTSALIARLPTVL